MHAPSLPITPFTTPHGRTLRFTRLGLGGAPLGNLGRVLSEDEADFAVAAAWDAGLRYFDTAPLYGHGLSEHRLGRALAERPRRDYLLSTKVGRVLEPCAPGEENSGVYLSPPPFRVRFDYSADGVHRALESSLERLDRVDIVYVHDLERPTHGSPAVLDAHWRALTEGGGWRALADLRDAGLVQAIGLGVNDTAACERFLAELDPDLFLLAGRYTLLEQAPLTGLLPACLDRGVGVVIGGPYNSGILARPDDGAYNYAAAPDAVRERVRRLRAVCDRFGVALPAAALQFVAAHPAVVSVIPGGQTPAEVEANVEFNHAPIPADLWRALREEGLIDRAAPTPEGR